MRLLNSLLSIIVLLVCVNNSIAQVCQRCYAEGEKCTVETLPNVYEIGGLCQEGFICAAHNNGEDEKNWVCMKQFEEGETCPGESSCKQGLVCESNVCKNSRFAATGEHCDSNIDCTSTLATCKDNICTPPADNSCHDPTDCDYGASCVNSKCLAGIASGETCVPSENRCYAGLVCTSPDSAPTTFTCTPLFSKALGAHCDKTEECNENDGLYCSVTTNLCEKYIEPTTATNCTTDTTVCDQFHSCFCGAGEGNGKCFQSEPLPSQYAETFGPLTQCILDNKCTYVENFLSQDSCISKKCGEQFCKHASALVNTENPLQCGNTQQAEQYCNSNNAVSLTSSILFVIISISSILLLL